MLQSVIRMYENESLIYHLIPPYIIYAATEETGTKQLRLILSTGYNTE